MAVLLLGSTELKRRLDALKLTFQPAGRAWADETVRLARIRFSPHSKTGKTQASIRRRSSTKTSAVVAVQFTGRFIEGDVKAHTITAKRGRRLKFSDGGRTIFAPKVVKRARRGTPFLAPSASAALATIPLDAELVKAWNSAA